uniref:Uncharacterized protein n=1 Tax=Panagrolaimus superbus TaxID=310955 RepID=A0A914YYY7_9BILA
MSIPILYCYILNQSIPKSIKIAALEILREKLKCLIQTTPKEILMKFPHPIPAMYEIYAQNPTILYDDEWKKFDENSKK